MCCLGGKKDGCWQIILSADRLADRATGILSQATLPRPAARSYVHCPNQTCAVFVLVLDSTNNICVRGEPDALIYELLPISRRIGLVGHLVFAVVEFFPDHWDCCHGSSCALVESLLLDSCMNQVGIICLFAIWSSWFHYLIKGSGCDEASFLGTCT